MDKKKKKENVIFRLISLIHRYCYAKIYERSFVKVETLRYKIVRSLNDLICTSWDLLRVNRLESDCRVLSYKSGGPHSWQNLGFTDVRNFYRNSYRIMHGSRSRRTNRLSRNAHTRFTKKKNRARIRTTERAEQKDIIILLQYTFAYFRTLLYLSLCVDVYTVDNNLGTSCFKSIK